MEGKQQLPLALAAAAAGFAWGYLRHRSQRNAPVVYSMESSNANGRECACQPVSAGLS